MPRKQCLAVSPELGKILLLKIKTATSLRQFLVSFRHQQVKPCKVESCLVFIEVNIVGGRKGKQLFADVNTGKQRDRQASDEPNPT